MLMTEAHEVEPSAAVSPEPGLAETESRSAVFFRVIGFLLILFVPYTFLQACALLFWNDDSLADPAIFAISTALSLVTIALVGSLWLANYRRKRRGISPRESYNLVRAVVAILLAGMLFHVHLTGSMSSMHLISYPAILLISFWFLRWQDFLKLAILSHVALVLLVWAEMTGLLSYAPLFDHDGRLRAVFLEPRIVLGTALNYSLVLGTLIAATIWLRRKLDRDAQEREELMLRLNRRVDQVKTLEELLPICASCKSIRDDSGYWKQVDHYLNHHAGVKFTHGMCPSCARKLFPEHFSEDGEEG